MRSAPAQEAWSCPSGDLLGEYEAFVSQLACGSQGKYLRRMAARRFLERWPDPTTWMRRPTRARLAASIAQRRGRSSPGPSSRAG